MLRSPDAHARAAATRVLCYWRDRVQAPLELLRVQINDDHPRVRLEAIRALSFFREREDSDRRGPGNARASRRRIFALRFQRDAEHAGAAGGRQSRSQEHRVEPADDDREGQGLGRAPAGTCGDDLPARRHKGADRDLGPRLKPDGYPPAPAAALWNGWPTPAASRNRPSRRRVFRRESSSVARRSDAGLLPEAIRLASAWKVKDAGRRAAAASPGRRHNRPWNRARPPSTAWPCWPIRIVAKRLHELSGAACTAAADPLPGGGRPGPGGSGRRA